MSVYEFMLCTASDDIDYNNGFEFNVDIIILYLGLFYFSGYKAGWIESCSWHEVDLVIISFF